MKRRDQVGADTGTHTDAGAHTGTDADADAGTDMDADTDADTDADADTGADTARTRARPWERASVRSARKAVRSRSDARHDAARATHAT